MDLYRTHIADLNTVDEADAYWRRYKSDFSMYPHSDAEFSLKRALTKLSEDGGTRVCFIIKLRLCCENMKRLFKNDEIMPTSLLICSPTNGVYEVVREIHL